MNKLRIIFSISIVSLVVAVLFNNCQQMQANLSNQNLSPFDESPVIFTPNIKIIKLDDGTTLIASGEVLQIIVDDICVADRLRDFDNESPYLTDQLVQKNKIELVVDSEKMHESVVEYKLESSIPREKIEKFVRVDKCIVGLSNKEPLFIASTNTQQ